MDTYSKHRQFASARNCLCRQLRSELRKFRTELNISTAVPRLEDSLRAQLESLHAVLNTKSRLRVMKISTETNIGTYGIDLKVETLLLIAEVQWRTTITLTTTL